MITEAMEQLERRAQKEIRRPADELDYVALASYGRRQQALYLSEALKGFWADTIATISALGAAVRNLAARCTSARLSHKA